MGVAKGSLDESIRGVVVTLCVTAVLVMVLHFLRLVSPVEVVRGEVAACRFQDTLNRERFMDRVMGVHYLEALGNDVLNAGVESFEESGVEVTNSNLMVCKEGSGDSQEVPVILQDLGLVTDARLS